MSVVRSQVTSIAQPGSRNVISLLSMLAKICLAFCIATSHADAPAKIKLAHTEGSYPPYSWIDQRGDVQGIIPALENQIIGDLGFKIDRIGYGKNVKGRTQEILADLVAGNIDVVFFPSFLLPEQLGESVLVIENPVSRLSFGLYTIEENKDKYRHPSDLRGATGMFPRLYPIFMQHDPYMQEIWESTDKRVSTSSSEEAVTAVLLGKVDFLVAPRYVVKALVAARPTEEKIALVRAGEGQADIKYQIGVSKAGRLIGRADDIKNNIEELQRSGKAQLIINRELNRYVSYLKARSAQD